MQNNSCQKRRLFVKQKKFRDEVGSAFLLRLERMRVSITAYKIAREKGEELVKLIEQERD